MFAGMYIFYHTRSDWNCVRAIISLTVGGMLQVWFPETALSFVVSCMLQSSFIAKSHHVQQSLKCGHCLSEFCRVHDKVSDCK